MCHLLPLIAFADAFVQCYGKNYPKNVYRSMRKALFFMAVENEVENQSIVFLV